MQPVCTEEPPSLFWGLDPVFLGYARLYIKDLLELKESSQVPGIFFYKDHPIKQVDILGIVVCVQEKEAFYIYGVDDSTGVINCTCWKTSAPNGSSSEAPRSGAKDLDGLMQELRRQDSRTSKLELGEVIRVRGYLKVFRNQREVLASAFYKVEDPTLDVQIGRMLELPYLYRHVYDKPFTVPEHLKSGGQSDKAVSRRSGLIALLSQKIMEFLEENKICSFYQRELESVPALLTTTTNPLSSSERESNTASTSGEIHSVFREAIELLVKRGVAYQRGQNKEVYKVTDHDKDLQKLTLNIIREDCTRQRHADKGCHFSHVLNCVRQRCGSCVSDAVLQRVIDTLERNSDIVSTMDKCYTAF